MSAEPNNLSGPLVFAPLKFRIRSGGRLSQDCLVTCPKCEAPATIRDSERVTVTVKDLLCICSNPGCGHTFRCQICFVHTLSPGLIDRPDLSLPVCPRDQVSHVLPPPKSDADDGLQISMFDDPSAAHERSPP